METNVWRATVNSRDAILERVRSAIETAEQCDPTPPRGYRSPLSPALNIVDLFVERLADNNAFVATCVEEEVPAQIALSLGSARRVVVPDGLSWDIPGSTLDTCLSNATLDKMEAVVSEGSLGIAETGTVVLTHGPGEGRRTLTLLPDLHVCIVRATLVVPDVPQAFARLDPLTPTTWISGPSATSDIEMSRVEGVHGPRRLHVLIVRGHAE